MVGGYTRRSILATLSAGVAGCTDGPSSTPTDRPTATPNPAESADPTETPTPTQVERRSFPAEYYQGPLVSAHEHLNGPDGSHRWPADLESYTRWMDSNGVARAMMITPPGMLPTVRHVPDRIIPFLFAEPFLREHPDGFAEPMIAEARQHDDLVGLGEFGLYPLDGEDGTPIPPDHPELLELYDFAADEGYPVMVHAAEPWRYDESVRASWDSRRDCPTIDQLARAYEHNRDTQFLVHGSYYYVDGMGPGEVAARAMDRHPNLHYDVSGISPLAYQEGPKDDASMDRSTFERWFAETGVEGHAASYYEQYRPVLEDHSDRALWGMDASLAWHFNDWVFDRWIDVGRSLLGRLPEAEARNVGYRTAETLFGVTVGA